MLRSALSVLLLAFALQAAQAQLHGVPASVGSPTANANGELILHGIPSSVTSPTAPPITSDQIRFRGNQHFRVHFGGPHRGGRRLNDDYFSLLYCICHRNQLVTVDLNAGLCLTTMIMRE